MTPKFSLTQPERMSPVWLKLLAEFEARLQAARVRNDSPQLDDRATAALRAEIAVYRQLIGLNTDRPDRTE